jgi:hypothetical protein
MPSTSAKQARFMAAAAHDPSFAAKAGISQSVAREFNQADIGNSLLRRRKPSGNALRKRRAHNEPNE